MIVLNSTADLFIKKIKEEEEEIIKTNTIKSNK